MSDDYSKRADHFAKLYEKLSAEDINRAWSHLLPSTSALVLDIGAGSGRDAAWLAAKGHTVVAVDPATELLKKARALHPESSIRCVEDRLPALKTVARSGHRYDLILLNAVWMHIAPDDRERAFRKMIALLRPGGKLVITLRLGPSPDERMMYPVTSGELHELAEKFALEVILDSTNKDLFGRSEVAWNTIVFWLENRHCDDDLRCG